MLRRSTGFTVRSFVVAALFGVHPINVENVNFAALIKEKTPLFVIAVADAVLTMFAEHKPSS
jgi:hypothetical protein